MSGFEYQQWAISNGRWVVHLSAHGRNTETKCSREIGKTGFQIIGDPVSQGFHQCTQCYRRI